MLSHIAPDALGETVAEPAATAPAHAGAPESDSHWAVPIATAVAVAPEHWGAPMPVAVVHGQSCTKCMHITQIVIGCITGLLSLLVFAPSTYAIVLGALGLMIGISATVAGVLYNPCGCCCGHEPLLKRQQVAIASFVPVGLCLVDIIMGIVHYASFSDQQVSVPVLCLCLQNLVRRDLASVFNKLTRSLPHRPS